MAAGNAVGGHRTLNKTDILDVVIPVRRRLGLGFHLSPDGKSLTTGAGTQSLSNTMTSASIKGRLGSLQYRYCKTLFAGALMLGFEQVLVPLNVLLTGS
jgi:hypothetical protein